MKVAIISTYPPKGEAHPESGGVASYTHNLATALAASENDVHVICNQFTKQEKYTESRVAIHRVYRTGPLFFLSVYRYLRKFEPDVIHIQQELNLYGGPVSAYELSWLVRLLRARKVIVTLHGIVAQSAVNKNFIRENNSRIPSFLVKKAFSKIYRPLCKYADSIIVHEQAFARILEVDYGLKRNKARVIPHGVENLTKISQTAARQKLNLPEDAKVVLFMGYLTGYKGLDLLIEGFTEFSRYRHDAILVIAAGKHPKFRYDKNYLRDSYNRLRNKANNTLKPDQYRWVGFIKEDDITAYYSAADLTIYPYTISMSSSGPMAFSIGFGVPFIASDAFAGFLPEELLFRRSPTALNKSLEKFFNQPQSVVKTAIQLKTDRAWDVVANQHLETYCE